MPTAVAYCSDGTPLEFTWNQDHWQSASFRLNAEHWKYPATQMDIWLDPIAPRRTQRAFDEVGLAHVIAVQFAGPFQYAALMEPAPEQLGEMMAAVGALMGRFGSPLGFWQQYCEPRAREAAARLEGPLKAASMEEVADTYAYGIAQTFTSIVPLIGGLMPLRMLLAEVFGPEGEILTQEATQGGENASQNMDAEVVGLAALARATPAVLEALTTLEGSRRRAALEQEPAATTFLQRLDELVQTHATRSFGWELALPTWGEDPDAVLSMIAALVRTDRANAVAASSGARRDAARQRILAALAPAQQAQFQGLVGMLDGLVKVREDRAYWQMRLAGAVRRLLLDRGGELVAAGRLDNTDDILHLVPEEFEGNTTSDLRPIAKARREEWTRFASVTPPPFVGAPPVEPAPPPPSEGRLQGIPVSRGVVTGRARIFQTPDDIDRMNEGDILVGRMTTPAWTPLFGLAGAVVMETGDNLSHPAITAREYGIPCVLGVQDATKLIADGALITVDGLQGTVTLG